MQRKGKQLLVNLLAGLLLVGVVSCQKTEEAKTPEPTTTAPAGHEMPATGHGQEEKPSAPKQVLISDEVRAAWTSVTIAVKDKESGTVKNYEVTPETEFAIPDTELKLQLGAYLPDFSMTPDQIVSRSAEPNNPAIQMNISDGGVEKYKGWLFAKFPDMHAFEHPKYGISLVDKNAGETAAAPAH